VIDHIHANPAGDLSLDALAEVAAMSRFHWHRVFHGMTGETVAEAVRRIRMHRASFWLVTTGLPIAEIAAKLGYPSVRSFARAFAEVRGMTPASFRKRGEESSPFTLLRKGHAMAYEIEVRDESPRRLFAVAHRGPYMEISRAFEKLSAIISARNLWS
jgi:AraC family transcriptional regulator